MYIKLILTIAGIVMMIQGIVFYSFSEPLTVYMFPDVNDQAIQVGSTLRQLMAGGSIFIGIILFLSRKNVTSASRRILFGSSLGFFLIFLIQLKIIIYQEAVIFFPILILWALLSIISFYSSYKSV